MMATRKLAALFSRVDRLEWVEMEPSLQEWEKRQPSLKIVFAGRSFRIWQPFSSLLVYLLGFLTAAAGCLLLFDIGGQRSRLWWGISLLFWGIGAILAGTSYQAFGYQIKCQGRRTCRWTSWWEIVYLILQQLSLDAMVVGIAYTSTTDVFQKAIIVLACLAAAFLPTTILAGAFLPYKPFITFEFMVLSSLPVCLIGMGINTYRFVVDNSLVDGTNLLSWLWLIVTGVVYIISYHADLAGKLYKRGIWFTENDILHVMLIFWSVFLMIFVVPLIRDFDPQPIRMMY